MVEVELKDLPEGMVNIELVNPQQTMAFFTSAKCRIVTTLPMKSNQKPEVSFTCASQVGKGSTFSFSLPTAWDESRSSEKAVFGSKRRQT